MNFNFYLSSIDFIQCKSYFETMCNLMDLPVEIQEMILSQLSVQDLLSMSRVCRLWYGICEWIAREKFSKYIPEECIKEVKDSGIPHEEIWLTALKYDYLQKCIVAKKLEQRKSVVAELDEQHLCFCTYGPLVLIGCASGEVEMYQPEEGVEPILRLQLGRGPVLQVEAMRVANLLLARAPPNEVIFLSLPSRRGKSWQCDGIPLMTNVVNFDGKVVSERNFSVSGAVVAVVGDPRQVCVFRVTSSSRHAVALEWVASYVSEEAIGHVALWREEALVMLKTGGVVTWWPSRGASFVSERYYELHYENPLWAFRGRIFCSTLFSSQLLGYWHMDRGAQYWLVGRPARELVRCRDLGTADDDDPGGEEVLCVCLKQRLLACGTRSGKVLVYYLSDSFFSHDEFNLCGNHNFTREFNRLPDLTIATKERPIIDLHVHFHQDFIAIYTWPCRVQSRPELKGLVQCILLKGVN